MRAPAAFRVLLVLAGFGLSGLFFSGCSVTLPWQQKSGLQVISNDVPATVILDGKSLTQTPYINRELKPGEYMLEIQPSDATLFKYQTKVSLKPGLLTVVSWKPGKRPETSGGVIYEMEPAKNGKQSELSINTIPDGAIVHVDGQAQGFSPIFMDQIPKGEHEYEVKLPSYETQKHTINVLEGYRMIVTLKLAKQEYDALTSPTTLRDLTATSSATVSATPAATAAAIATKSATATASAKTPTVVLPKPKVIIKPTGYKENGVEGLRVRAAPTGTSAELGLAPVASEYSYMKETQAGWYKISFQGKEGWVSGQYATLQQ